MKPLLATLLAAGGAGAAVASISGFNAPPLTVLALQAGGAAGAAVFAGIALAMPHARRGTLIPLTASILGVVLGIITYFAETHDKYGFFVLGAIAAGVMTAVLGGAIMAAVAFARRAIERDPWVGSIAVTGAWAMATVAAVACDAPSAATTLLASVGLVSLALASRKRVLEGRAFAHRGATAFRDGPSAPAPSVRAYRAAMVVALGLVLPLLALGAFQTRSTAQRAFYRELPSCEASLDPASGQSGDNPLFEPGVLAATSRSIASDETVVYIVGEGDRPFADPNAMLHRPKPPTCRWNGPSSTMNPKVTVKNAERRPVDVHLEYHLLYPESKPTPEKIELLQARLRANVKKSFEPGPTDARRLDSSTCWRYDHVSEIEPVEDLHLYVIPDVQLFNGAIDCFSNDRDPAWPTLGKVEVVIRPPPPSANGVASPP